MVSLPPIPRCCRSAAGTGARAGPGLDRDYNVEDTGREVKGRELDLFIRDCSAAKKFGRQTASVQVLEVGKGAADARASAPKR